MKLITGNADGLNRLGKLALKGVNNYIILAGKDTPDLDEKLGYAGADVALYAQTIGLNTWWNGGMYSAKGVRRNLSETDDRINGIIAIGYGQTQGVMHKSKSAADISRYNGTPPQWFIDGIDALLYAPTAINRQAFMVEGEGNRVSMRYKGGIYAGIDLGIGKYHFEIGAGKENFEWV